MDDLKRIGKAIGLDAAEERAHNLGEAKPAQDSEQLMCGESHGGRRLNRRVVLHRALDQAFRWRLLPTNVADLVDPRRF